MLALDHESRKLAEEFSACEARLSHARLELERISRERSKARRHVARTSESARRTRAGAGDRRASLEEAREELTSVQQDVAPSQPKSMPLYGPIWRVEERRRSIASAAAGSKRRFAN